jgi:hypothetical protein
LGRSLKHSQELFLPRYIANENRNLAAIDIQSKSGNIRIKNRAIFPSSDIREHSNYRG